MNGDAGNLGAVLPAPDLMVRLQDPQLVWLFGGILGLLVVASVIGAVLRRTVQSNTAQATVENLNARIRAWWIMSAVFVLTIAVGRVGSLILFALMSLLALREYITLIPTRRADHRILLWTFFVVTPLQYYLIGIRWYGLFAILIPVAVFVLIPTHIALGGDTEHFLERAAKIQFGIMICVYCLSYAPAQLMLNIPRFEGEGPRLLLFLVIIAQLSDVLKYTWGKLIGRHKIVPGVSPNKTWEGFVGGVLSATAIGAALWRFTPFQALSAAGLSLVIALLGAAGGLVMSAIKRDANVKDFGSLIEGHGGMLDRIDSICFAAPVFFHIVRYYYVP
jgi:phosphatidate cytidylyltransferase